MDLKIPEFDPMIIGVMGLAAIALVVSYFVYRENQRLKNQLNGIAEKKPCGCDDKEVTENSSVTDA